MRWKRLHGSFGMFPLVYDAQEDLTKYIRILLTVFFVFVLVRGVISARRGDGFRGTIV